MTTHGDSIHAYATIHYSSGLTITTPQSTHAIVPILPLGARRVRAVTFRDDFNSYNQNNWSPEISMFGGMNWEFQVYTPEGANIFASNGNLHLHPTLTVDDPRWDENFLHSGHMDVAQIWGRCTNDGNYGCVRDGVNGLLPPVMSGKVSSNPTIRFGTVEVRAKIPSGDWLWPAIWMMPKSSVYGGWPRSGEIDIMESRGNGGDNGVGTVSTTLHWGPAWDQNRFSLTHGERHGGDYSTGFHTYRLDWTQDYLRTYVDNQQIFNVDVGSGFWAKGGFSGGNIWSGGGKAAPFDQDFFLMLNVAVGGTNGFFPDNINWGTNKPWANTSPHAAQDFWNGRNGWLPSWQRDNTALQVDYVEFRN
jgi:beta-glucanase (GH16 family)